MQHLSEEQNSEVRPYRIYIDDQSTMHNRMAKRSLLAPVKAKGKAVTVVAQFSETGELIWNQPLVDKIKKLGKTQKAARRQPGGR